MTAIFITSDDHRTRWLQAMEQSEQVDDGKMDLEYGAALYILTSNSGTWQKASDYIDSDGINFEGLLQEVDFSGAYKVLIELAGNLFNGQTACSPVELMRLDARNFSLALAALQIRRDGLLVSDLTR